MPVSVDEKWATFALEDYRLVVFLWKNSSPFYSAICFHAQQFVEKIIKGVLEGAGDIPPRTHDINALAKRLAKLNIPVPACSRSVSGLPYPVSISAFPVSCLRSPLLEWMEMGCWNEKFIKEYKEYP